MWPCDDPTQKSLVATHAVHDGETDMTALTTDARVRTLACNGIKLRVFDSSPVEPPARRRQRRTVLLLHGFPDSHRAWRNQITPLVASGLRVLAPDLRGFGLSDRPQGIHSYTMRVLCADLDGILDTLGIASACVVGHDFGAALAWAYALLTPARVEKLVALSVGHPAAFGDPFNVSQREKSWYMLYFQFEGVAEEMLSRNDFALYRAMFGDGPEQQERIRDLSRPGALTAALNLYRANVRPRVLPERWSLPAVQAPTMGMWSSGDTALTEEQMQASARYVAGPWRYQRIEGAGHWLQLDRPDAVNAHLLDFLL
jgi:pimeloyl-ACP methyl ester carboxylesterase